MKCSTLLWSSHLLWCGHGGSDSFWVDEVWEPWDSCDLSSAHFILSWSPTKCLEHSSTWMPVLFSKRHSQICRTLGKFYTPAFPSGFVGGLRRMLKLSLFHTESHSPVSAEPTSCIYCLYDLLLHPRSTFFKKNFTFLLYWC